LSPLQRYGLTEVINARGPFTPLGVSRSAEPIGRAVAAALGSYVVMEEMQDAAGRALSRLTGAEAGTVTHCVAAGITLAVAAAMTGGMPGPIAALPDTAGLPNQVVLPAGHVVNYGHSILQAIRLSGAVPVQAGTAEECRVEDIEAAFALGETACLMLVSSRLTKGAGPDVAASVAAAHRQGIPVIIDGAAQDMRIGEMLATGADLVLVSGQKYLASPTAGLVIGRRDLVRSVRAQEKGIGRGMKASKEAIAGVLAAIELREGLDLDEWRENQSERNAVFARRLDGLPGVTTATVPDPAGMPFDRVHLRIEEQAARLSAPQLAAALRSGAPPIHVMDHLADQGEVVLELVQLGEDDLDVIAERLATLLS